MIAWAGALRFEAGLIDGARRAGAGALAARSGRREGARRGGEGMRIGVDRRRRLGHRARPGRGGGRRGGAALGARARSRRGDQRARTRTAVFLKGVPLARVDPRDRRSRRSGRLRSLADRYARRSICAACSAALPAGGKPLVLCAKGIEDATGLLMHEVAHEVQPRLADRGAFRPDLRARSRRRPADRGDAGGRGPGARRAAGGADRAALSSGPICPTTSPAPRSAARSRTCSPSPAAWSRGAGSARMPAPR